MSGRRCATNAVPAAAVEFATSVAEKAGAQLDIAGEREHIGAATQASAVFSQLRAAGDAAR